MSRDFWQRNTSEFYNNGRKSYQQNAKHANRGNSASIRRLNDKVQPRLKFDDNGGLIFFQPHRDRYGNYDYQNSHSLYGDYAQWRKFTWTRYEYKPDEIVPVIIQPNGMPWRV